VEFEWDDAKAASNERKHGISFDFATLVFDDPNRIEDADSETDDGEERWTVVGLANDFVLFVVYTMRGIKTRLISARKATSYERRTYWNR
jgi:uncharacterized DUF497 family protein